MRQLNSDIRRKTRGHKERRPRSKTLIDGTIDTFQHRSEVCLPSLATHDITDKKSQQKVLRQKTNNASHLTMQNTKMTFEAH